MPYTIDNSHSEIGFVVRHMVVAKVRGHFSKFDAKVDMKGDDFSTATLDVSIDAGSIDTREEKRDAHLRSADFFDAEKHATITFRSKSAEAKGAGEIEVRGDLTIHGVTKEVVLAVEGPTAPAKDPWGNERIGASASTKIKRTDFGLVWNVALEAGGILVGEDVKIALDVSLIKG